MFVHQLKRMLARQLLFLFFLFLLFQYALAEEVTPKKYSASRTTEAIHIDGILDEGAWKAAAVADRFAQLEPSEGFAVSQETEVRLVYDNTSIYIGAILYDTAPDSILHELGNRDEAEQLNADAFKVGFDPYNNRQSGYVFEVTASGVQTDVFNDDYTFDAVWQSAVKLSDKGWVVEMKIPYSAIRFPAKSEQLWAVQFARFIRRNREYDQWTLTPKAIQNKMIYWGTLEGIQDIKPPLRLSLTPYFSVYGDREPRYLTDGSTNGYENSYSYSGGADVKVGLDERFTLDMTLLPDFSQVQSDNKVKNLTAFETQYTENRPFFKEGTDLYSKGKLFYSRRIGRTPGLFYEVPYLLSEGEIIDNNPDKAKLLNATKISGRTNSGLGIGVLNAVTGNTYAKIQQPDGQHRRILTEPLTNYNLIVLDQQLKNNSNFTLVNTNVMRNGSARDANVTTGLTSIEDKKHKFRFSGRYAMSRIYENMSGTDGMLKKEITVGNQYSFSADKISGLSQYGANYEMGDKNFNKNDMGYISVKDYTSAMAYYSLNVFNPFWTYFKQGFANLWVNRNGKTSLGNIQTSTQSGLNLFLLFSNNWSLFADAGVQFLNGRDYYEPRVDTMFFTLPKSKWASLNVTTNYNKKLSFDFGARTNRIPEFNSVGFGYYINPQLRISDKWSIRLNYYWDTYNHEVGFAYLDDTLHRPVFGSRNIHTITSTFTTRYLFKNDMSLSLSMRHYWSQGKYEKYYVLQDNGTLSDHRSDVLSDFNSNYFNIDLVYNWQFAPGSSFLVTYKNQIISDNQDTSNRYLRNLKGTLDDPQVNSLSIKVLYYLDYQYLVRKKPI